MPLSDDELMEMKKEITLLHDVLTARGVNSRRVTDVFGREVRCHSYSRRARERTLRLLLRLCCILGASVQPVPY